MLADAAMSRLMMDVLTGSARTLVNVLEPEDSAGRQPLLANFHNALRHLQADTTLSRADRQIRDGYERQAVITSAAWMLGRVGLWSDSEALLKTNLAKSHSPYYLMSQLGGNARRQGRNDEALRCYGEAFDKSRGPATPLQRLKSTLAGTCSGVDAAEGRRAACQALLERQDKAAA